MKITFLKRGYREFFFKIKDLEKFGIKNFFVIKSFAL